MRPRKRKKTDGGKPKLEAGMSVTDFRSYYWLKDELSEFSKRLGLPIHGDKPKLSARIERQLRGLRDLPEAKPTRANTSRDSDKPLTRRTRVIVYKSDDKTRSFFESQIGPEFHFTYHMNQFRLRNEGLSYGDLVDEWIAERDRRQSADYQAPIAAHGKYNRFVRDFFADPANRGKPLEAAAAAWNAIKNRRGGARYESRKN